MEKSKNSAQFCTWNGIEYSDGATVCQAGTLHQCRDGQWDSLGSKCEDWLFCQMRGFSFFY